MRFGELADDPVILHTRVAESLRTTPAELAATLGLGPNAFASGSRTRRRKTQARLRQMVEILKRVEPAVSSPLVSYAWFRSEPLPGFGGATPGQLLQEGRAGHVHAYLDRIMDGGYA